MNIESVKSQHEDRLMQLPNVSGVGIGIGQRDGNEVIKVFVTHKVPESTLREEEMIPRELDGHGVDVEEIGVITAQIG